jgi:hypothetical protein
MVRYGKISADAINIFLRESDEKRNSIPMLIAASISNPSWLN